MGAVFMSILKLNKLRLREQLVSGRAFDSKDALRPCTGCLWWHMAVVVHCLSMA